MDYLIFIGIFTICAAITSIITEGVKYTLKALSIGYKADVVALVTALVVGPATTVIYYIFNDIQWTTISVIGIFLMTAANWLGASIGYDKVKETIVKIITTTKGE